MCGVFAASTDAPEGVQLSVLRALAKSIERRGPEAFGFAWIDQAGRLHCFKRAGKISNHLDTLDQVAGARMIIGHTRYSTSGSPADNINNHPHPVDGGWLVHNGVIRNAAELVESHRLFPTSECDSELLGLLMARIDADLPRRAKGAIAAIGSAPLVMLGLWSRPARLMAVRSGNPLYRSNKAGALYLCTVPVALPGEAREVPDNSLTMHHPQQRERKFRISRRVADQANLPWFVR